jgi:AcrR family transcriptional regulator
MATRAPSRRDRKRDRTRNELVGSARALIAERGVASLRVIDVTERSDVALGSFYSHFETKEEIVEAVVADAISSLADALGDVSEQLEDPAEAMSVGARQLVGLGHAEPELARLLLALDHAEDRFHQIIWPRALVVMRRGVRDGRFRADDPELMLTLAIAGVFAGLRLALERPDDDELPSSCAAALLRLVGLRDAEARKIAHRPMPALDPPAA